MFSRERETNSGKQLLIRQLITDDIDRVQTVFQKDEFVVDDLFLETIIAHPEYGQRLALALIENRIVGKIRIGFTQYDVARLYVGNIGFFKDLIVVPDFQNDGIGSSLLDYAEELVRLEEKRFCGLRIISENVRPMKLGLRKGYNEMFMELPDAFDLYKDLNEPPVAVSEQALMATTDSMIEKANALCKEQGMADIYRWALKA
jgi:GNAT superfamily N-acetyltransferase